jgi:hypothetical protein
VYRRPASRRGGPRRAATGITPRRHGDYAAARALFAESLGVARAAGDRQAEVWALFHLANLAALAADAETVVRATGGRTHLVVVAQSFGGYTAPLVCARLPVDLLVLVAGMVPAPGESAEEMSAHTGYRREAQADPSALAVFYHDVPPDLAAEALALVRHPLWDGLLSCWSPHTRGVVKVPRPFIEYLTRSLCYACYAA